MIQVEYHDEELNRKLRSYQDKLGVTRLSQIITRACLKIETEAKRGTPVDTSRLRSSITSLVTEQQDGAEGRVGTNVSYAPWVHGWQEGGTWVGPRRHFVPFSVAPGLKRWLYLKAHWDLEKLNKMKGIMVGGKPPTPFLVPLLAKYKPEILDDLRKALEGV